MREETGEDDWDEEDEDRGSASSGSWRGGGGSRGLGSSAGWAEASGGGWVSPGGSAYGRSPPHRCVQLRAHPQSQGYGGGEEEELALALALSLSLASQGGEGGGGSSLGGGDSPGSFAAVCGTSAGSASGGSGAGSLGRNGLPPRPPRSAAIQAAEQRAAVARLARGGAAELSYERLVELEDVRPVAPLEVVDALPVREYEGGGEGGACSICQSDYETGEKLLQLPCGHVMHNAPCAREWLLKWSKRCPECKGDCTEKAA